ncbi:MAG: FtsX-like permease family protein [Promethearchaeota archaeon]
MVQDLLSLYLAFIRNNWKILFVSTIGLTLALATVTETNVIVTFYRQSLFEDFLLSSSYGSNTDFIIKIDTQFADINTFQSKLQETVNNARNLGQNTAEKLAFTNFIERELWHLTVETEFFSNYSNDLGRMDDFGPIETLDNDTLQIYKSFLTSGELPQGSNETILIVDEYTRKKHNLKVGDAVQLSLPRVFYWEVNPSATAIISGIIEYKSEDRWFLPSNISRNTLWDYTNEFYGTFFITNQDNFVDFITTICENRTVPLVILDQINIDRGQLDSFNLGNELTRFERFSQQLELECNDLGYSNFYVSNNIVWKIQSFEFQFGATLLIMWLFSIPTIITTLFLANFSLSLLRGRKKHQIDILKTRGASPRQILIILFGESIITTLLSVGLGCILGFLFAFLAIQNDRFLDFAGRLLSFNSLMDVFQPAIFFGLLFAVVLNLRSIFRMARMDINESLLSQELRRPLWKKFYLDGILLGAGLLGVLIIVLLTNLASSMPYDPTVMPLYMLLSFVALFFGIPSPILITIGGAMLIARLLPVLLRKAALWTWKLEGGIVAFSFRNVLHRLSHASRATLLISIVIAFSIAFISIPYNADKNTIDNTYYHDLGADMSITVTKRYDNETLTLNYTLLHYLQNNLTGVASVSPVAQASGNVSSGSITVLGVDVNTYAQTAFFREDFLNQDVISSVLRLDMIGAFKALMQGDLFPDTPDLNSLLSRLQSNTTFLLQEDNLKTRNVNVGEQISLLFLNFNETSLLHDYERYDFDIVGTFKAWPLFISYPILPGLFGELYLTGNLSTILDYANATLFEISTFHYLIRVNPGVSKSQLKDQILNETGFEAETIDGYMERYLNSTTRNVLMTTLSSSFFMLIIVSLFSILMFSSSQLMERGKEIGIERVLGMSLRQTSLLFVIEALIIVLFGTMVGIILGIMIAQVFLSITMIAQAYLYPPFVLSYPWDLFAGITTLILAVGIISSLIPAYLATRTKISNILRTEESKTPEG